MCGALETDEVGREIVDLGPGFTFLVVCEGVDTVEHGRLFCEDLGILDAVLPLDRVQLIKVLQERNTGDLFPFANNLLEQQKNLTLE